MRKMEGERILKSLLNGETDNLFEDTKVCECSSDVLLCLILGRLKLISRAYIHLTII